MADYLLDTSVLILALRGQPLALDLLDELKGKVLLHISVATRMEVFAGMHPHEEERTLELLQSLESLPITALIADQAGRWVYQYARREVQISFPDAIIAATALHHGLVLATTNAKHFPMPELHLHPVTL